MCNDFPSAAVSAATTYYVAPYLYDTIVYDLVIEDWSLWRALRAVALMLVLGFIVAMWATTILRVYTSYTTGVAYKENGAAAQKFRTEIETGVETPGLLARKGMGFVEDALRRDYLRHRAATDLLLNDVREPQKPGPTSMPALVSAEGPSKKKKKKQKKARMRDA